MIGWFFYHCLWGQQSLWSWGTLKQPLILLQIFYNCFGLWKVIQLWFKCFFEWHSWPVSFLLSRYGTVSYLLWNFSQTNFGRSPIMLFYPPLFSFVSNVIIETIKMDYDTKEQCLVWLSPFYVRRFSRKMSHLRHGIKLWDYSTDYCHLLAFPYVTRDCLASSLL